MLSQYPRPEGLPPVLHEGALDFRPITLEAAEHLLRYLVCQPYRTCDYSVGAIYQWRAYFDTYYTVLDDMLLQIAEAPGEGRRYAFPVGPGSAENALAAIERDAAAREIPLAFSFVPEEALPALEARYGSRLRVHSDRDWADYLYLAKDLMTFSGKKLHGQKNHLNRFKKEFPGYRYVPVTPENYETARDFLRGYKQHTPLTKKIEMEEMTRAQELLRESFDLGMIAGYVEVDGTVVALSIGEVIGDTMHCHVEKARLDYPGAYQAIVSEFAMAACREDTLYINREDDSGEEGLRTSKLAYHPIRLLPKYRVEVDPE